MGSNGARWIEYEVFGPLNNPATRDTPQGGGLRASTSHRGANLGEYFVGRKLLRKLLSMNRFKILAAHSSIPQDLKGVYHERLVAELATESGSTRAAALRALFETYPNERAIHLLRMVSDRSNTVRAQAVLLIGETASREFVPLVSALLSDGSPDVRAAARDAARKLGI